MKRETKNFCRVLNQLGFGWLEVLGFGFRLGFAIGLSDFKLVGLGCEVGGVVVVLGVGVGDGSFVRIGEGEGMGKGSP